MWRVNVRAFKCIIFKLALFNSSIWKLHLADAVLNALDPLSFVAGAVFPVHLAIPMPLVILVAALVIVAALPGEHAHAALFVVFVGTVIHIAVLIIESLLPLSSAVLETILEGSDIDASVLPLVLAISFRFAKHVLSRIAVPICEDIRALTMLKAVLPFALISVPVLPLVDAVAGRFGLSPLADV